MKKHHDIRSAKGILAVTLAITLLFLNASYVFSEDVDTLDNGALSAALTVEEVLEPTAEPMPAPTAAPTQAATATPEPEPIETATPAPTNAPTPSDSAEPTAEIPATQTPDVTATTAPTLTQAPTDTISATPEVTLAPEATSTLFTGDSVAEMLDVSSGYLSVLGRATVHETALRTDDALGLLAKGAIVYATERRFAGERTDRLLVSLNTGDGILTAYIDAQLLYPLTDAEIARLREEAQGAGGNSIAYYDDNRMLPLPLATYTPKEAETVEPLSTPEAEPSEAPLPSLLVSATEDVPLSTEETGEAKSITAYIGTALGQKSLQETQAFLGSKAPITYVTSIGNLQSNHDYANNTDAVWGYVVENAARVTVTFSADTYVEHGVDVIRIYDAGGNYYAQFTGNALAGRSVTVRGNCMYVHLISNATVTGYGFRAVSSNPYTNPILTSCFATGSDTGIQLRWAFYSFIDGYYIYRATTTQTGRTGAFTYLASVAGSQTAYVDTSAIPGSINSYKILAYTRVSGQQYRSGMSNILNMSPLGKAAITSVTANDTDSFILRWNEVPRAQRYVVYASSSVNGTYSQVCTTADGATSCTVSGVGEFLTYFKLRAMTQIDNSTYMGPYSDTMAGLLSLASPTITSTHSPSEASLTVNWTAVAGASGYQLFRASSAAGPYATYLGYFTGTSWTDTTVPRNSYSFYRIRTVVRQGTQTFYSALSPYCSGYPLAVPSGVTATLMSGTTARLTWNGVSNATHFDVFTSTDGVSYTMQPSLSSSERSLTLTFDEGAGMAYFKIRAVRVGGTKRFASNLSGIRSVQLSQPSTVTYRALSIGQLYRGTSAELYGTDLDANSIKWMLDTMTATPFTTTVRTELTASGILSNITNAFADADSDDVSLFFYSGHGLQTANSEYLGSLCGVNATTTSDYVTPTMLRNRLDTIPGKKIVFINACHSGNMIGKGVQETGDEAAFTKAFINTFSSGGKSNLATNDYYVLVAASGSESGYMIYQNGIWAGVFTRGVCMGSGWNELGGYATGLNADANADRSITLAELYNYVVQYVNAMGVSQTTQVYPTGSGYNLYGRNP